MGMPVFGDGSNYPKSTNEWHERIKELESSVDETDDEEYPFLDDQE